MEQEAIPEREAESSLPFAPHPSRLPTNIQACPPPSSTSCILHLFYPILNLTLPSPLTPTSYLLHSYTPPSCLLPTHPHLSSATAPASSSTLMSHTPILRLHSPILHPIFFHLFLYSPSSPPLPPIPTLPSYPNTTLSHQVLSSPGPSLQSGRGRNQFLPGKQPTLPLAVSEDQPTCQ